MTVGRNGITITTPHNAPVVIPNGTVGQSGLRKGQSMNDRDEANEMLMGGGAKAFPFESLGDTVTGTIVHYAKRQQRDLTTNALAFWDDGSPKMMLVVVLQTDLTEGEEDDGCRSVYLRAGNFTAVKGKGTSSMVAVKDAVRRSGATGMETGATLTLQWSGEGKAPNKGFNAPKLYSAAYVPATAPAIGIDELV